MPGCNADPDGDGVNNLHEYLFGEDPTKPNPVYQTGYAWDELPKALSVAEKQQYSARINLNPYPDKNGKLVHAFLYNKDRKLDGKYLHMVKWVNKVKGTKTGWTTRNGIKHHYYLTAENGIGMDLIPEWAGIYGFWSPVAGKLQVKCRLVGDKKVPVKLFIKLGDKELFSATCKPGKEVSTELDVQVALRDRIDFIVQAESKNKASIVLFPEIKLVKLGDL